MHQHKPPRTPAWCICKVASLAASCRRPNQIIFPHDVIAHEISADFGAGWIAIEWGWYFGVWGCGMGVWVFDEEALESPLGGVPR